MLPERIGRYDVRGLAGSGGFATVYEGFDPRLDARVAIKVLADNWSSDPEIRRRFRQEAVLLRRLHTEHGVPGLVEVFDVDETKTGQPFFVMGWAGGGTLAARAKRKPWPGQSLRPVIVAMTQSLGHLHAKGVVHRDIKPQNLLLRANRTVAPGPDELIAQGERLVLGDFGLAKDMAVDASTLSFVGGTERYMAPEQLVFGGPVDHRADIYAATAMVEELLTGRGQVDVAPALKAVLQRGMATDPDGRYASMADWQSALLTAIDESKNYQPEPATVREPIEAAVVSDSYDQDPPTEAPSPRPVAPSPVPVAPASPAALATAISAEPNPVLVAAPVPDTSSGTASRLAIVAALAILAGLAAFFLFRDGSSPIVGPATIESGETVTYQIDSDDATVTWIDPAGIQVLSRTLDVTGRLPGQLTFSAMIDGEQIRHTVNVEASDFGPRIVGPRVLATGQQATYQANVPAGHTFFWIHPTQGAVTSQDLTVVQTGEDFVVGLISVDENNVERGDQILVRSS